MKHTKNHKEEDQNPKKENPYLNEATLKRTIKKSGAIRMHGFAMSRNRRNQAKKDAKDEVES